MKGVEREKHRRNGECANGWCLNIKPIFFDLTHYIRFNIYIPWSRKLFLGGQVIMDLYNKKKIEEEDYEIQEFELNMTKKIRIHGFMY